MDKFPKRLTVMMENRHDETSEMVPRVRNIPTVGNHGEQFTVGVYVLEFVEVHTINVITTVKKISE